VVILDGINALPQSREAAASVYRIFHTPTIAIGEEQIAGSHFAYIADTLLEVSQVFHRGARYRKIRVVKTRLGPSPGPSSTSPFLNAESASSRSGLKAASAKRS
jgi:DNA repair protein RadA/Sms